jgi:hypothetical protein
MMIIVKKTIIYLFSKIPFPLAVIPYQIVFFILTIYLSGKYSLWIRNSLKSKNICFGISDIDLSLYVPEKSLSEIKNIVQKYRFIKKVFPIIGELNIYKETNVKLQSSLSNAYEMSRDPQMSGHKEFSSNRKTNSSKTVFLMKMLCSDLYGLQNYPYARRRKWLSHARHCNFEINQDVFNFEELLKNILSNLDLNEQQREIAERVLLSKKNGEDLNSVFLEIEDKKTLIALFTIEWVGASSANDKFYEELMWLEFLNENEKDILRENLKWEIFGIYGQYNQITELDILKKHLENLKDITSLVEEKYLYDAIDDLCNEIY